MNEEILHQAGLTYAEVAVYTILVKNSPCTPPKLADLAKESRTNTYKLLETLEEKGIVSRDETQKKLRYWANNPSNLLGLLKAQRAEVEATEKRFQNFLPAMIDEYFKHSEQPSIRYFHGKGGVKEVYEDQLKTREPITLIHSGAVVQSFGVEEMHSIRNKFPARGIARHVFYPDIKPSINVDEETISIQESDKIMNVTRTWLQEGDLNEPVEWAVYGNKLSIISLGSEFIGMIIESPQITASFKEILDLLDRKIKLEPAYDSMPRKQTVSLKPDSVR
jgi:sugar-specific transcriptional regulator TrmB